MQITALKVDWLVLAALALLSFVAFVSASNVFGYVCLAVLIFLTIVEFRYALFFYTCMLPVWGFVGGAVVALGSSYILIGAFFIRLIASKESLLAKHFLSFILVVLFFALLGTLTSGYYEYFHTVIIFISVTFVAYIYANQILSSENNMYYIAVGLIIAALIALIVSYVSSGGDFRRLSLGGLSRSEGGNIRQLANILGVSLILFPLLFEKLNSKVFASNTIKYLLYGLATILLVGLLFTASRGVILAVFLSIAAYFIFVVKLSIKKLFLAFFSVLIGTYFVFDILVSWLDVADSLLLLEDRFDGEAIEGGVGSRLRIWGAGLSNMTATNYLFGHGFASFRFLALQSGIDYYSHSVFVAILTDTGLIPFALLLLLIAHIVLNIKRNKSFIALPILVYVILSHLSHGGINSTYFWLLLAIAYALSKVTKLNQKQQIPLE